MKLEGCTLGFAITGSHCTYKDIPPQIVRLRSFGAQVIPILSHTALHVDSRFGEANDWRKRIEEAAGHPAWTTVAETELIGPKGLFDCLIIAPCTGNTLARLAHAFTDGPVLMAAKSQMRIHRPIVIAVSTNDALGLNSLNLAKLFTTKDIYFVPMGQDDPLGKPKSLVAHMSLLLPTCFHAMEGRQFQPLLVPHPLPDRDVDTSERRELQMISRRVALCND
ncbi:dipicolinate synthase subunit B [Pasteuria penetrans]|uniref:dipicolinate synthase subunit B n=1 Tax=Pasteuria penetrans TaxID=86005 RepID=UPI000FAB951F|nr:dipicolinate synthase subunit B [Pasteuria penetrans]